jgi:hypothetical protein
MLKFIISSLSLLFFCAIISAGEADKTLHSKCLYPTILISSGDGHGSGVIVRSEKVDENNYKNIFISCAHIADDKLDYEVKHFTYEDWSLLKQVKSYPATFYGRNEELDVSIGCFFSDTEMPIAALDFDTKIYIGNEIFRIGCGLGDEPRLDYGKLTWITKGKKPILRTSILTVPGDSGSPVFHNYKVVGIMISIRVYRNLPVFNISYALPLDRFKIWDEQNNHALDFAWSDKPLPKMPFHYLEFKNYEISK